MTTNPLSAVEVVDEEPHFILINKPSGLFSQAAGSIPSLQNQLQNQLRERDHHPGNPFVGLPHRLDRSTSGIMLIARNARALKRFGQQFQTRKIGKFYLAIVQGILAPGVHRWQDYIRKIDQQAKAELVGEDQGGREAILECVAVANQDAQTMLLIRLHTGRMHQIRVQAAGRGLPILGDELYGSQQMFPSDDSHTPNAETADFTSAQRIALHALRLEFRHPQSAKPISGTAGLDDEWKQISPHFWETALALVGLSRSQPTPPWALEDIVCRLEKHRHELGNNAKSIDSPS